MRTIELGGSTKWRASLSAVLFASMVLAGCGATETATDSTSGRLSAPVSGGGVAETDTSPPSTPTGLTGAAVSSTRIDLSWQASTDDTAVTGYLLYRDGVLLVTLGDVTSFQDTVGAGSTHSYTVQAVDGASNLSGQSPAVIVMTPAVPDTTPPSVPTNLSATTVSTTRIDLSWSPATDNVAVTGYRIYRGGTLVVTLGNVTSYRDRFLVPGVTYLYTISALDGAGNASGQSSAVSATTAGVPDTTPPTAPTGLSAGAVSPTEIDLSWTKSTDNDVIAGYRVYRNGALVATLGDTATYQDMGVAPATTYSYNVDAVDASGNVSALSAPALATTPVAPDTIAPQTPTGVSATAISATSINVAWNASLDNVAVTGYQVFRNGSLRATLGTVTVFQDTGLTASTTYSYRIRAFDAASNQSSLSATASATTLSIPDTIAPSTPTGLAATAVSDTEIDLTWNASTDNVAVTGYRIYRNGSFLASVGNVTSFQNTGLSPSTAYTYNVDAVDGAGNASSVSAPASATTQVVDTTATLEWDPVVIPNLGGYRIYYGTAPGVYLQAPGAGINVSSASTTYTVTGLSRGTRYYFAATAYDSSNKESTFSNEVFKDIP